MTAAIGSAQVTVNVVDLGNGAWTTEFVRLSSATGSKLTVVNIGTGVGSAITAVSGALSNPSGGVFQVGANVTSTNQIRVAIGDPESR